MFENGTSNPVSLSSAVNDIVWDECIIRLYRIPIDVVKYMDRHRLSLETGCGSGKAEATVRGRHPSPTILTTPRAEIRDRNGNS